MDFSLTPEQEAMRDLAARFAKERLAPDYMKREKTHTIDRAVLKEMGRYEEALADLNTAIRIKPTAKAYNNRGNVRKRLGNFNGAASDYRSSLELDPRPETYFNLALVLEEAGDMDGAMRSAQKASELGFRQAGE